MAVSYKILGQSSPANTLNADLYTVPASTQAVISTIAIANTTAASAYARVYVREDGAGAFIGNAIMYDVLLTANSTLAVTLGITLNAADVITVRSSVASALTFHAFGSEIA